MKFIPFSRNTSQPLFFLTLLFYAIGQLAFGLGQIPPQVRNSVLKIMVVSQEADFENPWHQLPTAGAVGSGFYIGNGRILTNAHVVSSARFLTVQKDGDANPQPAKIRFVAHDYDLAIVEVENREYLRSLHPLPLGELPRLHSMVTVIGYPKGGTQISMTQGTVSRIEYRSYASGSNHLIAQVDAAINSGNSGGPVVQAGKVVGVAFLSLVNASNIHFMIPTPIIRRFLKDIEDGTYDGHIDDGLTVTPLVLTNPSTRSFYQIPNSLGGIKIEHIASFSSLNEKLKEGDIIFSIDNNPIGADGLLRYGEERVDFRTLFDLKQLGETVQFQVLRSGKMQSIPVLITKNLPHPSVEPQHVKQANYVMFGGLLFMALSRNYLEIFGRETILNAPVALRYFYAYNAFLASLKNNEQIVILTQQLPSKVQVDPEIRLPKIVKSLNGLMIHNLAQLANLLHHGSEDEILIQFWNEDAPLVLSRKEMEQENPQVMDRYDIKPSEFLETVPAEDAAMVQSSRNPL